MTERKADFNGRNGFVLGEITTWERRREFGRRVGNPVLVIEPGQKVLEIYLAPYYILSGDVLNYRAFVLQEGGRDLLQMLNWLERSRKARDLQAVVGVSTTTPLAQIAVKKLGFFYEAPNRASLARALTTPKRSLTIYTSPQQLITKRGIIECTIKDIEARAVKR